MNKKLKKGLTTTMAATMAMGVAAPAITVAAAPAPVANGWSKDAATGKWYYYSNSTKKTGWVKDGATWYYMYQDGSMATGWTSDGSNWYFMNSNGSMATGWRSVGGNWYFMNPSGIMAANCWAQDSSKSWFFLGANGAITVNQWVHWKDKQYFVNADGKMEVSTVIDGWTVDANGVWDTSVARIAVKDTTVEVATEAVTALETATKSDLKVEANLKAAEALVITTKEAIAKVTDKVASADLTVKVTAAEKTVIEARKAFDAEAKLEVEAETAVKTAETSKKDADIKTAKTAVETVKDEAKKKEFNDRIAKITVLVEASSVSAINETTIQVTGLAKEVKDADLKDKKIALKVGDVSLTATYVTSSLTEEGKANFVLDTEKKLTDAVTYTVSSDWANFTTNTFMAKGILAPYVNKVEMLTKVIPANTAALDKNLVNFTAENQYGEVIALVDNAAKVKVTGTLNGVPFLPNELADKTILANGIVEVNKDLKEGDKVTLTFTNEINAKTVEVGTVSYTVAKAEEAVATTVSDMAAKYADTLNPNEHTNATEAKEVLPGDSVKLSVKVNDQFGNPMAGQSVRWVVEEGKDLIKQTNNAVIVEVVDAVDFTFKADKAGKVKISAYNVSNGAKVTYEVIVGAQALTNLNLAEEAGTRFNQDENIVKVVTPNKGANLTADMIKFDVKAVKTNVDVTAADVTVTAKLRGGDLDNKTDIVIVVKSAKEGKYTITPYVGESLEKATAKVAGFDVTTTIDQTVTSIDDIAFDANELKTGKEINKDVTFRNKHNEVVVLDDKDATVAKRPVVDVIPKLVLGEVATVTKVTKDDVSKNVLTLNINNAKKYNIVISNGDVIKPLTLTFTAPTFTKIDAGADITGVVAGDLPKQAKDQAIKLLDQDGKEMNVKASDLTLTVTKPDGQALTNAGDLVKLAAVYGFDKDAHDLFDEATDAEIVKGFRAQPVGTLAQGTYTVKIANKNADLALNGKIADTFTVTVGAARVAKTVEVTPVSTKVALNGQVNVKVTPKDQYGEFIAVGVGNIAVNAGANFAASAVTGINKDGGAITGDKPLAAYEVTLTGKTKGTNDVVVNVMDKVGDDAKVLSTNKVSMTVDAVANLVDSVVVDKTDMKALYSTAAEGTQVQLKAIAKDVNGAVVPVDNADLSWTIKSVTGKIVEADATVATVGAVDLHTGLYAPVQNFKGTVTIEVRTANMKVGEVTLNLDPAKAVAKTGTTTVVNNTPEKIVDADEVKAGIQVALDGVTDKDAEANGSIVLKLSAVNQYGTAIPTVDIDGNNVIVMADDASVLTAAKSDANETITLTAKSVGTANVYVQYNGDTIKLEVAVNAAAVKAAEDKVAADLAALPVGVALGNTSETAKGKATVAKIDAVPEVTAVAGIYSVTIGTADVIIGGKTFTYSATTVASKWSTVTELVALINADTDLNVKYTAEVDSANVKLTQKAGKEIETAPEVSGTGASVATTKAGVAFKAAVAEIPAVPEVKEVATTAVTTGASKDATIKVKVVDGAGLDKTVDVAVKANDTAEVVAGKIQVALAADTDVKAKYAVTVNGANVVLTQTGAAADVELKVTL